MADELAVGNDIQTILLNGHLTEPAFYANGNGYPIISSIILRISGLEINALEFLSPFIGSVTVLVFSIASYGISSIFTRRKSVYPMLAFGFSLFVFGGYVIRLTQSSHKRFTYILIIVSLYLAISIISGPHNRKKTGILVFIISAIAFYNVVWAIIYGIVPIVLLIVLDRKKVYNSLLIALLGVFDFGVMFYLPTVNIPISYPRKILTFLLLDVSRSSGDNAAGTFSVITAWETYNILGYGIPSWFVFSSGIFIVAFISLASGIYSFNRVVSRRGDTLDFIYLIISMWFGAVVIFLIAASDVVTAKRMVVLPGAFGVMYGTIRTANSATKYKNIILALLIISLLLGSILAIPRSTVNGSPSPYDHYAEEGDLARVTWLQSYTDRDRCAFSTERSDLWISSKIEPPDEDYINIDSRDRFSSKIYTSGWDSHLYCA